MIISPSVRPACGKTTSSITLPILFGCWQNWDADSQNIKTKRNVTKMKDYASGSSDWIDPYATANPTMDVCSPYNIGSPDFWVCGDSSNGNVYCFPISDSYIQPTASSSTGSFPVGNFHNCYSQSNDTQSRTDCRDIGFKNVYARKAWQGKLGYTSRDLQKPDGWDYCCDGCVYHNADTGSPDTVKYLTITAEAHVGQTDGFTRYEEANCGTISPGWNVIECQECYDSGPDCNYQCLEMSSSSPVSAFDASATATTTIDIYGNVIVAECNSSDGGGPAGSGDTAFALLVGANGDASSLIAAWCDRFTSNVTAYGNPTVITSTGPGSWHAEWHQTITLCYDDCGNPLDSTDVIFESLDVTPTTWDAQSYSTINAPGCVCPTDDKCIEVYQVGDFHMDYSNTEFHASSKTPISGPMGINGYQYSNVTGALSNPYTSAQVYNDVVNLLSKWDFGNLAVYPWRQTNTTTGPVVKYDEIQNSPSVPYCTQSINHTGNVIGAPGPEGMDRIWDPAHSNWCICCFNGDTGAECSDGDPNPCYMPYIQSYGAWSTDCGVPRATAWLDGLEALNMPQGAFVGANFSWTMPSTCGTTVSHILRDDVLWACKYAEVIYQKQSFNYARPIGIDRFMISESSDRCIASVNTSSHTLNLSGSNTNINTGDYIWVCGTGTMDGLWTASSAGGHTITLAEPRFVSASQIASSPIPDCGTGVVYKLRWQILQPAICGRIAITSATNTTPVTCSISDPTYLINGDIVTITGSLGLTSINGNRSVIVIDSQTFVVSGSVSSSIGYTGGGQVYSTNAPDYKWCDVNSKGEFTIKNWQFNYRDIGEYNRVLAQKIWNEGLPDCETGTGVCSQIPTVPPEPRPYQNACGMDQNLVSMSCQTTCLPFNPCRANAAYFSPNSESFNKSASLSHSMNYGWAPSMPYIDTNYTTMWQAIPFQAMDDLYFTPPPCPCVGTQCLGTWEEDNGFCENDNDNLHKYYPARDVFEARCEPPSGSPALVSDTYMGCITTQQITSSTCPKGNICSVPQNTQGEFPNDTTCNTYIPHTYVEPWTLLMIKETCVCSSGRFSQQYMGNGISCPNEIVVPPP